MAEIQPDQLSSRERTGALARPVDRGDACLTHGVVR